MKLFTSFVVIALSLVYSVKSAVAQAQDEQSKAESTLIVKHEMQDRGIAPIGKFSDMVVTLEIEEQQSAEGLKFFVNIFNKGDIAIRFNNPLDFMSVSVSDEKKRPLQLPCYENRVSSESRFGEAPKLVDHLPFRLISVFQEKKALNPQEIEAMRFELPAKHNFRFCILIDKVSKEYVKPPADGVILNIGCAPKTETVSPKVGTYYVTVYVKLVDILDAYEQGRRVIRTVASTPEKIILTSKAPVNTK